MNAKNNQINEVKNLGKLPIWNLKDLYPSQNDKKLIKDLKILNLKLLEFEKKYVNKIKSLSAEQLFQAITEA